MTTATQSPAKRTLRFDSFDDILAEAHKIAAPGGAQAGEWTAAQNIAHVGIAIHNSVKGFPKFKIPLFFKVMGPLIGPRMLKKGLPTGIPIAPELQQSVIPPVDITPDQALSQLTEAIELAKADGMPARHPAFGNLTSEKWLTFHCRHAELHFGNIIPA